jgi:hypothetical protein
VSGRRVRALVAGFKASMGRAPHNGGMARGAYHESERRRIKKAHARRRRSGGVR